MDQGLVLWLLASGSIVMLSALVFMVVVVVLFVVVVLGSGVDVMVVCSRLVVMVVT